MIPSLHVDYKNSRIKQYHKEGRALRTETTINNTRDFGIGKRLHNLPALREVGFQANRRLLDVQRVSHDCAIGEAASRPSTAASSSPINGPPPCVSPTRASRRSSQPWSSSASCPMASPTATCASSSRRCGAAPPSPGRMTYDLRRLRLHGLIHRIPRIHRYRPTDRPALRPLLHPHLRPIAPPWRHCPQTESRLPPPSAQRRFRTLRSQDRCLAPP